MKYRRPSPAMTVACIALFVALGGTSIAAVNYASRAGAVDGKSAVSASATLKKAAGKLVATQRRGSDRGQIPAKFIDNVPVTQTFGRAFEVVDNATGAPETIGSVAEIGTLTASCLDQAAQAGREDPQTTISLTNSSGEAVNIARTVGGGNPVIGPVANGTVHAFNINGSNTFRMHVERRGVNMLVDGVVRQDGRGSGAASCLVYGTVLRVAN
jgi:hypothetical protein